MLKDYTLDAMSFFLTELGARIIIEAKAIIDDVYTHILEPVNMSSACWMSGKQCRSWSDAAELFTQVCLSKYVG